MDIIISDRAFWRTWACSWVLGLIYWPGLDRRPVLHELIISQKHRHYVPKPYTFPFLSHRKAIKNPKLSFLAKRPPQAEPAGVLTSPIIVESHFWYGSTSQRATSNATKIWFAANKVLPNLLIHHNFYSNSTLRMTTKFLLDMIMTKFFTIDRSLKDFLV